MSRANPRGGGVGRTSAAGLEVENVEATALLEFVQLACSAFQPNWKDDNYPNLIRQYKALSSKSSTLCATSHPSMLRVEFVFHMKHGSFQVK